MAFTVNTIIGAFRHSLSWLFSPTTDIVKRNPRFHSDPDAKTKGIAIYCIHGTADRANAFSHIAKGLLPNLPKQISAIHQLSFKGRGQGNDIPFFAEQVVEKILANGDKEVILMGHSRGGLVAAYVSEKLAHPKNIKVRAVVPICSPFQGSPRANVPLAFISGSVQQMQPDSEFLSELTRYVDETHPQLAAREAESTAARMRAQYLFFVAENDLLVTHDSCFVHRKDAILVPLDGHGHLSIMTSSRIIKFLNNFFHRLLPEYKISNQENNLAHSSQAESVIKVAVSEHEKNKNVQTLSTKK